MHNNDLIDIITKKEKKYFDLVWYARVNPEHHTSEELSEIIKRIESENEGEIEALNSEHAQTQNGFHIGVLAALRFIRDLDENGLDYAEKNFPRVDQDGTIL